MTDKNSNNKKNQAIIEKIKAWQNFDYVKPLICRKTREKLEPRVHKKSGKVILKTSPKSNSNYVQWTIPPVVLNTKLVVFDHAKSLPESDDE